MNRIKEFALQRPVVFSLAIILLSIALTEIPLQEVFAPYMGDQTAHYVMLILEQGITGLLLFGLVARFGWLEAGGFTPPKVWRALWLSWPLLVFTALNGLDFIEGGQVVDVSRPGLVALHALTALSTGWVEEIMGRSVVLVSMLQKWGHTRRGVYLAVLVSSALFGVAHLINFLQGRNPLVNTVAQMAYATFFGIIFAACMLRNRSVWPVMLWHAAFDWAGTLHEVAVGGGLVTTHAPITVEAAVINVLIISVLAVYGLFILRKVGTEWKVESEK